MKKLLAAVVLSTPLAVLAGPIQGAISFVGTFDNNVDAAGNGSLDFGNVIQWEAARTGDFQDLTGDFFNVAFGPLTVTAGAIDLPVDTVWTLNDGFGIISSFVLDTVDSYVTNTLGTEVIGEGVMSLTGYDDTRGEFILNTAGELTFDATASKVSGPATGALLGLGLIALGMSRRQRNK